MGELGAVFYHFYLETFRTWDSDQNPEREICLLFSFEKLAVGLSLAHPCSTNQLLIESLSFYEAIWHAQES